MCLLEVGILSRFCGIATIEGDFAIGQSKFVLNNGHCSFLEIVTHERRWNVDAFSERLRKRVSAGKGK